ncbi:hypothetical protein HBI56_098360 [Parastagonospora nodorum]|uniref:Uncharacterized protein n=1 Tax=Phaeosphaeria nodorum (strain SN15 / ATCC MYA-4574 / FGSC 10173) TaxID=321614 RepID=A0A7U2F5C6_PHANO|nr:hypothetical protein HBH56_027370 [Parastagonospora nodorum]QRC99025.1 hypothetical protein JI435_412960 [Parastagonospora nodorum SN15]KAH3934318.1 hypothetical protein HBH54_054670 [Parastagonospora nodorum]KAH3976040.1 hypothetical protein HBH51_083000 [Parastagonospora nodorum]KAH3985179.1 hypothetical protein HBH52_053480 [Parastagonospora nodorum]
MFRGILERVCLSHVAWRQVSPAQLWPNTRAFVPGYRLRTLAVKKDTNGQNLYDMYQACNEKHGISSLPYRRSGTLVNESIE